MAIVTPDELQYRGKAVTAVYLNLILDQSDPGYGLPLEFPTTGSERAIGYSYDFDTEVAGPNLRIWGSVNHKTGQADTQWVPFEHVTHRLDSGDQGPLLSNDNPGQLGILVGGGSSHRIELYELIHTTRMFSLRLDSETSTAGEFDEFCWHWIFDTKRDGLDGYRELAALMSFDIT